MAYPGAPGASMANSVCVMKVEVRIECKNLLNKDVMSKSDPCAAIYMEKQGQWREMGRTENVKNNLNPRFSKGFTLDYFFEEVQRVKIAVYDIDNMTVSLDDDDFLGQIECTLGQLVSNSPYTKPLLLRNGCKAGKGTITVRTEERSENTEIVHMAFRAHKLENKDFLGKSDPYLEFQKGTVDGGWQVVHRTEVIKNNLSPTWRPIQINIHTLCQGDRSQSIKIDCYDWDSDGSHDYIGGFTTTLDEMLKGGQREVSWPAINPRKKAKKKSYSNSGMIYLTSCKLTKEHTFLEYVFGGMQINFTVGIDFTGSNGHPSKPNSLHYISHHQPNEYMQAIIAVGNVCQDYDSDKLFPALGFGAEVPPQFKVSHEFPINFDSQNPFCAGIQGIVDAYQNCIRQVKLYGPTNASPIINHVARFATTAQQEERAKGAASYHVLLMLTDGVLSDFSATKQAIVNASKLPMSLIIVGVGGADFSEMNELDGDDGLLRGPSGEPVKRDIVQFVPFRDFKQASSVELARHVLAEIPKQVTEYHKMRGIPPNKPPQGPPAGQQAAPPRPTQGPPAGDARAPPRPAQGAPQGVPQQPAPVYSSGQGAPYPPQGQAPPPQQGYPAGPGSPQQANQGYARAPSGYPSGQGAPPQQGYQGGAQQPPQGYAPRPGATQAPYPSAQGVPPQQGYQGGAQQPPQGYTPMPGATQAPYPSAQGVPPQQGYQGGAQQPPQGYAPRQGSPQPPYPSAQGASPQQSYQGGTQQPPQGYAPNQGSPQPPYPSGHGGAPQPPQGYPGAPQNPGYPPSGTQQPPAHPVPAPRTK